MRACGMGRRRQDLAIAPLDDTGIYPSRCRVCFAGPKTSQCRELSEHESLRCQASLEFVNGQL